jgi:SanA protein
MKIYLKRFRRWLIVSGVLILAGLAGAARRGFDCAETPLPGKSSATTSHPANDVALVLGTSKKTARGNPNLHFIQRIEAAVELFKSGKVRHLIVSGDNSCQHV